MAYLEGEFSSPAKIAQGFPPTLTLLAILSEGTDWCLAAKKGVARREGIKRTLPS